MKKIFTIIFITFFSFSNIKSQEDSLDIDYLITLSFEDLINLQVETASKKSEKMIESPLSISVITEKEIKSSGATSIAELFRMVPGLIVREKTNGNFDMHIRGNDNLFSNLLSSVNFMSLVMIDNRVVYNYFQGGTFWETLPISVNDIEKIEIIRGPSSSLYGPNAVSGVINIITKMKENEKEENLSVSSNFQFGSLNTKIVNTSINYRKEKFGGGLNANYNYKERFQEEYFLVKENRYSTLEYIYSLDENRADSMETKERHPNVNLANNNFGVNSFIYYNHSNFIKNKLSFGMQNSEVQTIHMGRKHTFMNNRTSNTKYINLNSDIYDFHFNANFLSGDQDFITGSSGFHSNINNFSLDAEYNYKIKNLIVRPGISYKKSVYDDRKHIDIEKGEGFLKDEKYIENLAPTLRIENIFFEKLRFIASARFDIYNKPDENYLNYQIASTYKISKNNIFRTVYSRSNSSPFIYFSYINFDTQTIPFVFLTLSGNENLKLMQMDMYEIGYRTKIANKFLLDFEVFYNKTENFSELKLVEMQNIQIGPTEVEVPRRFQYRNVDMKSKQIGFSYSFNFIVKENLQIKIFNTQQYTKIYNFQINDSLIDKEHLYSPSFYGGIIINYLPFEKLNIFSNLYFYGNQYSQTDEFRNEDINSYIFNLNIIKAKAIINLKFSYKIWKNNVLFLNVRNVLNDKKKEFNFADDTGSLYLIGFNINF